MCIEAWNGANLFCLGQDERGHFENNLAKFNPSWRNEARDLLSELLKLAFKLDLKKFPVGRIRGNT